jgi:hypothetical protein
MKRLAASANADLIQATKKSLRDSGAPLRYVNVRPKTGPNLALAGHWPMSNRAAEAVA